MSDAASYDDLSLEEGLKRLKLARRADLDQVEAEIRRVGGTDLNGFSNRIFRHIQVIEEMQHLVWPDRYPRPHR